MTGAEPGAAGAPPANPAESAWSHWVETTLLGIDNRLREIQAEGSARGAAAQVDHDAVRAMRADISEMRSEMREMGRAIAAHKPALITEADGKVLFMAVLKAGVVLIVGGVFALFGWSKFNGG